MQLKILLQQITIIYFDDLFKILNFQIHLNADVIR